MKALVIEFGCFSPLNQFIDEIEKILKDDLHIQASSLEESFAKLSIEDKETIISKRSISIKVQSQVKLFFTIDLIAAT